MVKVVLRLGRNSVCVVCVLQYKQSTSCMGMTPDDGYDTRWDPCPQTNEQHKKESTLLSDQSLPLGRGINLLESKGL